MSSVQVLCEIRNRLAFLTLNRPAALNALSLEMVVELRRQFERHAADPEVLGVVIRGAGERAFCAGGDIRALYQSALDKTSLHREFFIQEYPLDFLLYSYPKSYVALMDGITMGGGLGLAQGSRLRVVGEATRIAMPEVAIGFFPDVGASFFLSRLPGAVGLYLALTGIQIRGADALYAQLADVYLPPDAMASLPQELGSLVWSADPGADIRRLILSRAAHGLAAPSLSVLRPAIDEHFSRSGVDAILASLDAEQRPGHADWARHTATLMRSRSPTLLCVTFEQLRRARGLSLGDCLRMELNMVHQCFEQGDFIEGIRALIVDKDNAPRWNPGAISEVTQSMIEAFFRVRWRRGSHPLADLERI